METSKRRQIPTTKACPNFSFRGPRKEKNFVTLFRDYFRHADELHTSKQRITFTQYAHTRAILLWPQPAGPSARPGLRPVLKKVGDDDDDDDGAPATTKDAEEL